MRSVYKSLRFDYKDFHLDKHARARLVSLMKEHLKEGRVTRDPLREKQWVGALLVERLVMAYFQHTLDQGTFNWDTVLLRILSAVLQSTLSCRAGDIARSQRYNGDEYLRWEHVLLKLVQYEGKEIIQAQIVLRYAKGKK